jgi:coenzyme F420-reducing hydrogenase alpha subunit
MHVSALANSTAARKLEANIRRVIVCVNACQEISNELLEASPITVIVGQMAKSVSDKTRDELLASLIEITDAVESAYELILEALPDGPIPDWFIRLESSAKQGRASISKARE